MTRIELLGLQIPLSIGIHPHERVGPQPYEVDLLIGVRPDLVLIREDRIDRVFDYDPIRAGVLEMASSGHFETQEFFLSELIRFCAGFDEVLHVEAAVRKTAIFSDARSVGLRASMSAAEARARLGSGDAAADEDDRAVDRFAGAMRAKLAASRAKGRDGWQDPALCPETRLAEMLVGHLPKGNPGNLIDLAILAMMLQERGADPSILREPLARGDLAQPWRPISEAIKGGPAIWARLRDDISVRTGRKNLRVWDGIQLPLRHPGTFADEDGRVWDQGWNVAVPVGHGGFPDDWIAGWVPLRGPETKLAWAQSDRAGPAPD